MSEEETRHESASNLHSMLLCVMISLLLRRPKMTANAEVGDHARQSFRFLDLPAELQNNIPPLSSRGRAQLPARSKYACRIAC